MIYALGERRIELRGSHHYVAPNATVVGSVILGHECSIWFNVVIRGDCDVIEIGEGSNVQDGAVLHTDPGIPLRIGAKVSIGHQAMLHGCTLGDGSLIGIKAVVLNRAVIGRECLIGANTLVPEGRIIPDRSLVVGIPGKVVRTLTDDEIAHIRANADEYAGNARRYLSELRVDPRGSVD